MQTGGAFNLFEALCPSDYATPLHIHYAEHVALYVLEGSLAVFWGGEKKHAAAGSYFFQPQGTPHGFRVEGGSPARILYVTFPAGFDRFIVEETVEIKVRNHKKEAVEVLEAAQCLERNGVNVVHMEVGEPGFETPPPVREAAASAAACTADMRASPFRGPVQAP